MDDIAKIAGDYNETESELLGKLMGIFLFKQVGDYIRPICSTLAMVSDENETKYLTSNLDSLDVWCDKRGLRKNYIKLIIAEEY